MTRGSEASQRADRAKEWEAPVYVCLLVLVNEVGQIKEANIVPRACNIGQIVSVSGATEQHVEWVCVRGRLRPLDFSCGSFEIKKHALTHGRGSELALASNEARIGEPEHVQFVFFEPPLTNITELPVDECSERSLTQPFEQRAHVVCEFGGDELFVRVIAEDAKLILVPIDESEPEAKEWRSDSISAPLRCCR
jgi:hypothetical protein